ncbi:AraC family transcriptional regulator [Pedobacter sp. PLR]|uniref:AraC family transcriptional regulator n=1 Tax=Pedobacter sp. PLR TaxID=2994465 RepID=UPI002244FEF0|nr:AraC family transcriptional regulator [Pedobacter sp. PLR]MCX2450629.1 AraC family transcriptional regulator [Pedobacter sp. PLR]
MEINHENFSVSIIEHENWKKRGKSSNFFELVYILEGEGEQYVNGSMHHYRAEDIFLLPSASCNGYVIEKPTRFLFIRFTSNYFSDKTSGSVNYSDWFNRLNFIIGNYDQGAGQLIPDTTDKKHIKSLLNLIVSEHYSDNSCSVFLVQNLLVSILVIISRNIEKQLFHGQSFPEKRFVNMLHFIHYNLLDQKKVSVEGIASRFHVSETYFSEYFKRNAKESFRDYVLRSKLKIAEARATLTSSSFKEIANELGFTDSSHLNKMMKKYYQVGMREIRNKVTNIS